MFRQRRIAFWSICLTTSLEPGEHTDQGAPKTQDNDLLSFF
jgi:hypothetical protein